MNDGPFDDPELDWTTVLNVYPNLTDTGRVRAEFDSSLKWEIFNDLNWVLGVYSSYDNRPNSAQAEKVDYGINTSLNYEF